MSHGGVHSLVEAFPAPSPTDAVAVRVLGPIEVLGPRGPGALVGARQRTLLGLLAFEPGAVLTRSRIIDALWGDCPPRTAVKTLYSHVVRLRQALDECGLAGVLSTRGSGYVLRLPCQAVDAWCFEDHVRRARQARADGDWDRAAGELRRGLRLWRGEAFDDGEPDGWGAAEVERLTEVRLCAQEELWSAGLHLGDQAVVAEIERSLVRHPFRERPVELLMVALYRAGRPTDALEAYHRLRSRLAAGLGVGPGPALRRLYGAILQREPEPGTHSGG
jgi:DNA-binding SARP family transcriptional activator